MDNHGLLVLGLGDSDLSQNILQHNKTRESENGIEQRLFGFHFRTAFRAG